LRTYEPLVGEVFELTVEDARVPIELVHAVQLEGRGECFSLLFRGPARVALGQSTYSLEHPALGAFLLFLVPVGPTGENGQELEAVINRPEG